MLKALMLAVWIFAMMIFLGVPILANRERRAIWWRRLRYCRWFVDTRQSQEHHQAETQSRRCFYLLYFTVKPSSRQAERVSKCRSNHKQHCTSRFRPCIGAAQHICNRGLPLCCINGTRRRNPRVVPCRTCQKLHQSEYCNMTV